MQKDLTVNSPVFHTAVMP